MRLRTRMLLGLGYVVFLAIVALEIPLALSLSNRVDSEVRVQASGQADVVAAAAVDLLGTRDRDRLQTIVSSAARSVRGRVVVVGAQGRLLADSSAPVRPNASFAGRPEIAAALAGEDQQRTRRSESLDTDLLVTAVPIVRAGRVTGAVRITQSIADVRSAITSTIAELLLIGLAVLLIGLAAGALIARQIARPLNRLERTARRVADGELSARAEEEGSAEQRSLATSFNEMTARISDLVDAQRRFVADASHQLRTPLAGLRLRLEAASSRVPGDRDLEAAEEEVQRLARIVEDLLVLSRAGERTTATNACDLGDAARRAGERFRAAADSAGVRLGVSVDAPAAGLCVPAELDRALDVLVENAIGYGAAGREVQIVVRRGVLEVLDRGPGPAPGEEEEIFERFHRGAASRSGSRGTGLGLSIARELARGWGGEATLRAREGGGAVAALIVPPCEPADARMPRGQEIPA